ncbi:hypothetical protein BJA01nite_66700 [Bradyrhizobium japonicum]|nr:hypothetical protein BJA01nite_66700 [Bradyrhizobium japonicum]
MPGSCRKGTIEISTKDYVPRSGKFQTDGMFPLPARGQRRNKHLEVYPKHQSRLMTLEIDEVEIAA